MSAPTPEQRIRQLVRRGIAPSEAERIVHEGDAAGGRVMPPDEAARQAEITETDKERARQWVAYNPRIPGKYKRLWSARVVKHDA